MIKLDADVPTTTHGFFKYSIDVLDISGLARIYRKEHSTLYKYARDPDRFPEGETRQDPLKRLLVQCRDIIKIDGERGIAAVRVVAGMFADLAGCDVSPREAVHPDKADVKGECLDDYPPLVKLHELITAHAPNVVARDQMRAVVQELQETLAAYEASADEGARA